MQPFYGLGRIFLIGLICLLPSFSRAYTVVFQVDMNTVYGYNTPYVSATFNNWCGNCNPMTDANHDGIWEASIELASGYYEYKFSADNWAQQESLTAGSACTNTTNGFTNRTLTVAGNATLALSCWGSCSTCSYYPITFQVNMNSVVGYTTPSVKGTFNNWCGTCNPMADPDGDKIFTTIINMKPGEQEFKFSFDNGATEEMFTSGMACTKTTGPYVNRVFTVTQATTLDAVCWATCQTASSGTGPVATVSIAQTVGTNPACDGSLLTFAATAQNTSALPIYSWKVNGEKVGSNTQTYTSANLSNGQAITCDIIGASGCNGPAVSSSNSITVSITPRVAPSVTISASTGATFCKGQPVVFTANPVNGGESPSYQWQLNGANVGTNSNTYTAPSLQTGQKVTCILTSSSACINTPWQQVWADEFNGTSLDTTWVPEVGPACCNNELQYYTNNPANIVFGNGQLHITALKENIGGRAYSSARLKTQGKFSVTYGRIEGKMKIPLGQGLWPAFWMLGANIDQISWPKCGEIDIMEHVNNDNIILGTPHWDNNGHVYLSGYTTADMSVPHVYAVEWDSLAIKFFVDDNLYHTHSIIDNPSSKDEFTKPFFLLLNLAIGGDLPGPPNDGTPFPSSLDIDYVRVLKKSTHIGSFAIDTSAALELTEISVPTPVITPSGPTDLGPGGSVVLTSSAGAGYLWSNGAKTPSITVATSATYTVQTIANACTSAASAPVVVKVQSCPDAPKITVTGSTTLCAGQNVRLTSSASKGNLWNINGATYQSIVINSPGSYSVRQVVGSCTTAASAPVVVTLITSLTPTITASGPTTLCGGTSLTLTSSNASSNVWSTSETTPSITVRSAGRYALQVVTTGCSSAVSAPIVVTVDNAPAPPTITASGSTTLCPGQSVRLTSSALSGNLWSVGNLPYRAIVVNTAISYTVRQIVGACTTAASVPVTVTKLASCGAGQARLGGFNEDAISFDQAQGIRLYPNPVSNGVLNVSSEFVVRTITVYSITGVRVFESTIGASYAELPIPLKPGTYLVEAKLENGTERKLIHWE